MTKYDRLTAMLVLIVVGITVTIKTIGLAATSVAASHATTISGLAVAVGH
jgi:hypothetical protein